MSPSGRRRFLMEWYAVAAGLVALLVVLILLEVPIPFALAGASLPFLWTIQDWQQSLVSAEFMIWNAWFSYILIAIPLFIFLGELIARSRIGTRFYSVLHQAVPVLGAAAYGSVGGCAGFGAICGTSMLGALTIGSVALPQMLRLGYHKRLASGVLAAGGTLSVLIPPSLILLFFGILTETSVGKLFIAGVIPGILLVLFFVVVIVTWRLIRPQDIPDLDRGRRLPMREVFAALAPIVVIAGTITGSIYFGIATPTEAAATADIVTLVLALTVGELGLRGLVGALKATLLTMGYLGLLLSAAMLFGFVLNYHRVPQHFTQTFVALDLGPDMVLATVIAFYVVVGMFLEVTAIMFITLPILYPLVLGAGYDMVWFGIIFTITMEIAVLTPPVGVNLYVLQGLAPDKVDIVDVIVGCLPFIGALCVLVALLVAFPQLALWLPRAVG